MGEIEKYEFEYDFMEMLEKRKWRASLAPEDPDLASKIEYYAKAAPETEVEVLSELIQHPQSAMPAAIKLGITAREFYITNNQKIFKIISKYWKDNESISIGLVAEDLIKNQIPITYFTEVSTAFGHVQNFPAYARILIEKRVARATKFMANEIKTEKLSVAEITKMMAHINSIESKKDLQDGLISPADVEIYDVHDLEKVKTGFREIDRRFLGYCFGSLSIITGYNGNGKSTLINQMCIAEGLAQGYKVMAYSPELTASNFKTWLYRTIANRGGFTQETYAGEEYLRLKPEEIKKIDTWIKQDEKLLIYGDTAIPDNSQQLLKDIENKMQGGYRIVVIDNLMKIDLPGGANAEYSEQKKFVNSLKNLAVKYNALVHLVCHPRKPAPGNTIERVTKYDISGSGDITNLADYVTAVTKITEKQRAANQEAGFKDAIIEILKDRIQGQEFKIDFYFEQQRKRFYTEERKENEPFEGLYRNYGYAEMAKKQENVKKADTSSYKENTIKNLDNETHLGKQQGMWENKDDIDESDGMPW